MAEQILTRQQLAEALTARGFPITSATLNTKASRGGGPPFHKFGRHALYRLDDALAWAQARCTAPRRVACEGASRAA